MNTVRIYDSINHWYFGPWFNIKMSSYQYRKTHCGDETVVRSSYLHNGFSYTGKMTSLYWIRALVFLTVQWLQYFCSSWLTKHLLNQTEFSFFFTIDNVLVLSVYRSYISDEARLFDTILRNYRPYKKLSRPVLNVSATIPVSFGISLIQILGFDVKQQVLTTLIWKKYVSQSVWTVIFKLCQNTDSRSWNVSQKKTFNHHWVAFSTQCIQGSTRVPFCCILWCRSVSATCLRP